MKIIIEYDITDCRDCPFRHKYIGHGEAWFECIHKEVNRGAYGNILYGLHSKFKSIPNWCPLKIKVKDK